jgi:hypothetical protein
MQLAGQLHDSIISDTFGTISKAERTTYRMTTTLNRIGWTKTIGW